MRCSMTDRKYPEFSDGVWDDGEWISWDWIYRHLHQQELAEQYPLESARVQRYPELQARAWTGCETQEQSGTSAEALAEKVWVNLDLMARNHEQTVPLHRAAI